MSAKRWDALLEALRAAGLEVRGVDAWRYPGGVTRSISFRTPRGQLIEIADTYARRNDSIWTGWQVHLIGRDDITIWTSEHTKVISRAVAYAVDAATAVPNGAR